MKNKLYVLKSYFSKGELLLWSASTLFVLLSFAVFDGENYLILLWSMAAMENVAYTSVVVCFAAFFINDVYGFINWNKMGKRQAQS